MNLSVLVLVYLTCVSIVPHASGNIGWNGGETFLCANGGKIAIAYKCDQDDDCGDNSDESEALCKSSNRPSNSSGLDACKRPTQPPCSQHCVDFDGEPECSCTFGYYLDDDERTCKAENASALLYLTLDDEIRVFDLNAKTLLPVLKAPVSQLPDTKYHRITAVGRIHRWIFYAVESKQDFGNAIQATVYRADLNAKNQIVRDSRLVYTVPRSIVGFALDWLNNRIYIAEARRITLCNIQPLYCKILHLSYLKNLAGIVVAPKRAELSWVENAEYNTDFSNYLTATATFYHARLDGKGDAPSSQNATRSVRGFSLDPTGLWLTWYDWRDDQVRYCSVNGQCGAFLKSDSIAYVTLFEHQLYWVNATSSAIEACALTKDNECGETRTLFRHEREDGALLGPIFVYYGIMHNESAIKLSYPCHTANCTHFCFWDVLKGISCSCPDDMKLDSDGFTCVNAANLPFLLLSTGDRVLKLFPDHDANVTFTWEELFTEEIAPNDRFILEAAAYNWEQDELYAVVLSENKASRLVSRRIMGFTSTHRSSGQWLPRTLVHTHLRRIPAMVYDVNTENLYWVDEGLGTLDALCIHKHLRASLRRDLIKPISLAFSAADIRFYISLREASQIMALDMDGKNLRLVVPEPSGFATTMALFHNGRNLLWGDSTRGQLSHLAFDNQTSINTTAVWSREGAGEIGCLTALNESVFWIEAESGDLFTWKENQETTHSVNIAKLWPKAFLHLIPSEMLLTAGQKEPILHRNCQPGRHKCAHLCLLTNSTKGHACRCGDGYRLQPDGHSCRAISNLSDSNWPESQRQAETDWERHRSETLGRKELNTCTCPSGRKLTQVRQATELMCPPKATESSSPNRILTIALLLSIIFNIAAAAFLHQHVIRPRYPAIRTRINNWFQALRDVRREGTWRRHANSISMQPIESQMELPPEQEEAEPSHSASQA